jgi:hypothetical protein
VRLFILGKPQAIFTFMKSFPGSRSVQASLARITFLKNPKIAHTILLFFNTLRMAALLRTRPPAVVRSASAAAIRLAYAF